MSVVRRQYFVEVEQDKQISEIAKNRGMDKSEIVQLALRLSLPEIAAMPIKRLVDLAEDQLRAARSGSIKRVGAARRSK